MASASASSASSASASNRIHEHCGLKATLSETAIKKLDVSSSSVLIIGLRDHKKNGREYEVLAQFRELDKYSDRHRFVHESHVDIDFIDEGLTIKERLQKHRHEIYSLTNKIDESGRRELNPAPLFIDTSDKLRHQRVMYPLCSSR